MIRGFDALIRARVPLQRRWTRTFTDYQTTRHYGVEVVWQTRQRFESKPRYRNPAWWPLDVGPFVIAVKVDGRVSLTP